MKGWKKGTQGLVIILLMLSLVISGCTKNGNNEPSAAPEETMAAGETAAPTAEATAAPLEPVELTWYYGTGAQQPDQQVVEDAVNKYLKEKTSLNVTLHLNAVDFGSYDQKLNPMIAANEDMDILWTTAGWLLIYTSNVAKGSFLALDELLPKYAPKIANEMMPASFWEDVKYPADQKIYAIPNYQIAATAQGFVFQKELVDKYKFDITTVKKTADLEPFLKTLKENEPGIIPLAFHGPRNPIDFGTDYKYSSSIWYDKDDPFTPVDLDKTPEKKAYWDLMHSWYDKGYLYQDLAIVKDFDALVKEGNIAVINDATFKPGGESELKVKFGGKDVVRQQMTDVSFTGVTATMNAISKNSKNPERALMLLELINTDKELYQLLCYGIVGTHYNVVDGVYQAIEGSAYAPGIDWVFGNQFNGLLRVGQPADLWEQTKRLNESAEVSPLYKFHFNADAMKTEEAAMNAVIDEYIPMLNFGVADPNVVVPKYLEALEKAGSLRFGEEVKKQLDAWIAGGKK